MPAANPPSPFGDVGTVKEALKTLFTGPDFERELVKVEARFADGVTLERIPPSQMKTSEIEGVPAQYPFLEIVGVNTAPNNDVEYADLNEHSIDVIVWMNGDDEETVTKLVERYLLAVRKLLRQERLMPMLGCRPVVRGGEQYGVVGKKSGLARPYVKAGSISFRIATIEADDQ